MNTLARLVGHPDRFLVDHWEKRPLLTRDADVGAVATLADFDDVLNSRWLTGPTTCSVFLDGQEVSPERYTVQASRLEPEEVHSQAGGLVRPEALLNLYQAGATIRLRRCERQFPAVRALCRALAEELGHGVRAHTYVTPPDSVGLVAHYDSRDEFIVQTAGSKQWELFAPHIDSPIPKYNARNGEVGAEPDDVVTLHRGDVLYVPRGWTHRVQSIEGPSMHIGLAVRTITHYHVASELLDQLIERPSLRRGLPIAFDRDPGVAARELMLIREAVDELLAGLTVETVDRTLQRLRASVVDAGQAEGFAAMVESQGVAGSPLVSLGARARVVSSGDDTELLVDDAPLVVPEQMMEGLRRLASGDAIRLADLAPDLSPAASVALGRRLVEAEVLEVMAG